MKVYGDFGELRVEREVIEVTSSLPQPDKRWRYTDEAGHEHHWEEGYPTLIEVEEGTYWCPDCRDEHTEYRLECRLCHEHITPGTRGPSLIPEYIPGPPEYYLNDERITEGQVRELIAELRRLEPGDKL